MRSTVSELRSSDWELPNLSLQVSAFTPQTKEAERLRQRDGGPP